MKRETIQDNIRRSTHRIAAVMRVNQMRIAMGELLPRIEVSTMSEGVVVVCSITESVQFIVNGLV